MAIVELDVTEEKAKQLIETGDYVYVEEEETQAEEVIEVEEVKEGE